MANDGSVVIGTELDESGLQKGLSGLGGLAGKGLKALGTAATAGIAAASGAVVAFGVESVKAGMGFDEAMSQVAATMGTTVDQIGDLETFAQKMGSETAFSATQAAQALNYMALAGYDSEKSMSMLPTVLNLAAAGGMDLATASDMVTDAQSALGLSIDDTTHLVDQMATTASKSNTSVAQLGEAYLTVGGTAKTLAGGTTELSTALGILADNGIKGSEGGTALRNIILSLSAPTKDAAEEMERLGINAFDADGNLRPLEDTFADLNGVLSTMTSQEQTQVLNKIFNKVDLKAANALLATSVDRWDSLSEAIDTANGSAKEMADVQLDNLNGDITLMKSAIEGAELSVSKKLTPTLRTFVQFGTREIGKLDKAFQNGGIQGLARQFGESLSDAVKMIGKYIPDIISAGATLAGEFVKSMYDYIIKNFDRAVRSGGQFLEEFGKGAEEKIPQIMEAIGDLIGKTIANVPKLLEYGTKLLVSLGKGIVAGIPAMAESIYNGLKEALTKPVSDGVVEAQGYLSDLTDEINNALSAQEDIDRVSEEWAAKASIAEPWLKVYDDLYQKENLSYIEQGKLNEAVEMLNTIYPELGISIDEETGKWNLNTEEIRKNIEMMTARAKAEIYLEKAKDTLGTIVDLEIERNKAAAKASEFTNIAEEQHQKYQDLVAVQKQLDEWISNVMQDSSKLKDVPPLVKDWADENNVVIDTLFDLTQASLDLQEETAAAGDAFESAAGQAVAYNEAAEEAQKAIDTLSGEVEGWFKDAANYKNQADKIGQEISNGVASGIKKNAGGIKVAGEGAVNAALRSMKSLAQIASPSKLFRDQIGQFIGKGVIVGIKDAMTPKAISDAIGFDGALFDSMTTATNADKLRDVFDAEQGNLATTGGVGEAINKAEESPRYVETTINIDGRETAKVLTPYVSKEIAWESA